MDRIFLFWRVTRAIGLAALHVIMAIELATRHRRK